MNKISLTRAAILAGVSYRRAHYWVTCGAVRAVNPEPGSGNTCWVSVDVVPVLRLLRHLSDMIGGRMTTEMLAEIARDFDLGRFDLGSGVALTWEPTEFIRPDDMAGMWVA